LTKHNVLAKRVRTSIRQRAKEVSGRFWRDNDWALFAFDGSRVGVPRTVSNEDAYCAPNYGSGNTSKYRKKKTKGVQRTKNEKAKGPTDASADRCLAPVSRTCQSILSVDSVSRFLLRKAIRICLGGILMIEFVPGNIFNAGWL